jgi:hypothetical protein
VAILDINGSLLLDCRVRPGVKLAQNDPHDIPERRIKALQQFAEQFKEFAKRSKDKDLKEFFVF